MQITEEFKLFLENYFTSFHQSDIDEIQEIIYNDACYFYNDCSGLLVYRKNTGEIMFVEYVFSDKKVFKPTEISEDEAAQKIFEKETDIND